MKSFTLIQTLLLVLVSTSAFAQKQWSQLEEHPVVAANFSCTGKIAKFELIVGAKDKTIRISVTATADDKPLPVEFDTVVIDEDAMAKKEAVPVFVQNQRAGCQSNRCRYYYAVRLYFCSVLWCNGTTI